MQGGVLLQDAAGTSGRGAEAGARGRVSQGSARAGGPQAAAVGPEAVDAALLKPTLAGAGANPGRRWGHALAECWTHSGCCHGRLHIAQP